MHIGLEVKKNELIILFVNGPSNTLKPIKALKLKIDQDSIKDLLDFRKSFQMLLNEEKVKKVSMVQGSSDSSKIRIILEYIIQEVCYISKIKHNTFASSAMKRLREKTFTSSMSQDLKSYLKPFKVHAYSENAFLVAWRYS